MRKLLFHHPTVTPAIQLSVRAALSAALAVVIASLLSFEFPLYALIAAIIVTDLSPDKTRKAGASRVIGSALGAGVGAAFSTFLPSNPVTIGLSVAFAMVLTQVARLRDATKLAGYVCGITMLGHADEPWFYAFLRLLETTLGVAVAILVSFAPKLLGVDDTGKSDDSSE